MAKENPNPVIHTTQKRGRPSGSSAEPSLGSSAIRRYNLGAPSPTTSQFLDPISTPEYDFNIIPEDDDILLQRSAFTAEDRSVALALSAAAYPTVSPSTPSSGAADSASPKLEILQQAGFALFHPQHIQKQCKAIRYPSYAPSIPTKHTPEAVQRETPGQEQRRDAITSNEVFDIIRNVQDPEHPLSLESLNVVRLELIDVVDSRGGESEEDCPSEGTLRKFSTVHVQFTPTIPHCSMATLIGLSLRVKLLRSLPSRFKVVVNIESGTHVSEHAVNKQLADKERVRAALENDHLLGVVNRCILGGMQMQ